MRTTLKILLIFGIISISFLKINAQNTDENTFIIDQYFNNGPLENVLNANFNPANELFTANNISGKTYVNISQVGNNNVVDVKANSEIQNINQKGNKNNYEFISFYGRNDLNFEIQQLGNSNLIQVLGENSLINNLKIIQKSNFKSITVTNY